MNIVSQYVLRTGAYLIFAVLLESILPQGSARKFVRLTLSLLFMYVLIQPVASWILDGTSLEAITMGEELTLENSYEAQAEKMIGQGMEAALQQKGLPAELEASYQLEAVQWGNPVQITLSACAPVGGITDRSLNLGQIGVSDEEDALRQQLCSYWGLEEDRVEIRLR